MIDYPHLTLPGTCLHQQGRPWLPPIAAPRSAIHGESISGAGQLLCPRCPGAPPGMLERLPGPTVPENLPPGAGW